MAGRRAATPGGKKAVAYLAKAFEDAGLSKLPGGDPVEYKQGVTMQRLLLPCALHV